MDLVCHIGYHYHGCDDEYQIQREKFYKISLAYKNKLILLTVLIIISNNIVSPDD